ncbi:MAG TPA: hypothetical protein VFX89_02865 [Gammaproteobacteria bacterium]|nr:hypothetical protein [Gammaproteobacteria bacterium]
MQLEELKAIWDTQTKRPVFAVNDFGLHMELYRSRERARRRLFWGRYLPFFVFAPFVFGMLAIALATLFLQGPAENGALNAWDGLACLVGMIAVSFAASSMYVSRRKNEKEQEVFAPSLREEIERSIALLNFDVFTATSGIAWRNIALIMVATTLMCWEVDRLNGNSLSWRSAWIFVPLVLALVTVPASKRKHEKQALLGKRALEALRAKLDENPAGS